MEYDPNKDPELDEDAVTRDGSEPSADAAKGELNPNNLKGALADFFKASDDEVALEGELSRIRGELGDLTDLDAELDALDPEFDFDL